MEIKKIMVVGAGLMGRGIAQVSAQSGFITYLMDIIPKQIEDAMNLITKLLNKAVTKGKITEEEKEATLKRLITVNTLDNAKECDVIIEAVTENPDIKKDIFKKLDELAPPHAILASNTSSIPITELAAVTKRPDKVIGMHFMNPVPVMKLVEIVRALRTSDETVRIIDDLAKKMGKETIIVNRDFAGFIVNRIAIPIINEAIWLLHDGMGTKEDIDKGIKLGLNHPMGPLTLADFVGLDTVLYICEIMYKSYGDPKYRPCPLLRQYVQAGFLGRKSGRGFYDYS